MAALPVPGRLRGRAGAVRGQLRLAGGRSVTADTLHDVLHGVLHDVLHDVLA